MARGDDEEYFQSVGAFSAEAVAGLQRCCDGVERGRLRRRALTPTFEFFFSARGMAVFAAFVKRWVDTQAGTRCIFSFCALWLRAAKLYETCYAAPPVFGRACGDTRWSAAEKVEMLRAVRDGLPRGIAAKIEPVKLVIEQIVCVALKAQEKLAKCDESVTEKVGKVKGGAKTEMSSPPKRARPAEEGKARKDASDRPLAAQELSRGWGKIPLKSPILAPGGSFSADGEQQKPACVVVNGKASQVNPTAKGGAMNVAADGNVNESFHERRGVTAVGSGQLNKVQALMRRKLHEARAANLPPVSPVSSPSSPAPENPESPIQRHVYRRGGNGRYPPKPAIRHVIRLSDEQFYYDASGRVRMKNRPLVFAETPTVIPIKHVDDSFVRDPSDHLGASSEPFPMPSSRPSLS